MLELVICETPSEPVILQSILENLQDCQPVSGPPAVRLVPETLCHEIELWLYIAVKRASKDLPS